MSVPDKNWMPGWPEHLTDRYGEHYVILRDGKPTSKSGGESCLYGLLDEEGYIDRSHQWIPNLGATENDMTLSGGSWSSPASLVSYGQTPIVIPDEPVDFSPA